MLSTLRTLPAFILMAFLSFASNAHAELSKVKSVLDTVKDNFQTAAVVVVTIAVLWVGYKILFGGQTLRECAPILLGGAILAGAAEIADMIVG